MSEPTAAILGIDVEALACYLRSQIAGFDGHVEVRQFQAGQSNPTFKLMTYAGDYVLRKKPAGKLLPSAHAIEREFAIMVALAGHAPVPKLHFLCEDEAVIGQPFYVMEYIEGRVLPDARLLDARQDERRALCLELVRVLARLHKVDYQTVGLTGFGKPGGYVERQLARWSKQYIDARLEDNADMNGLISWLGQNLPDHDEIAIVHGDYRSHNVIFSPNEPRIAAILDWELATIGNPLADLAYCLLPYHVPPDDMRGFREHSPESLGIPSEEEMIAAYCDEVGRTGLPNWRYHVIFALFRSAAIRAGIYKRAIDGTASNPKALELGEHYRGTAAFAWALVQQGLGRLTIVS